MKKNNTAEKAILDAEKISKALKEGTEQSLRNIVSEALTKLVKENCDEEDSEDDSYDVEDVNTEETPVTDENPEGDSVDSEGENADVDVDGNEDVADIDADVDADAADTDDTDEWSDMEDYKVGDNDYDFTGVNGDEILKVYNKLGEDDKIFVKKEEDGVYSVKDDETGAEFVIELDSDAADTNSENDFDTDDSNDVDSVDADSDYDENDGLDADDSEIELSLDDDNDESDSFEIDINDDENELNEENLGYTDSYQKDVFSKKFNMSEPADSKSTYSMDGGIPNDSKKPWAGKGDMKPFGQKKDEIDECGDMAEEMVQEGGHERGAVKRRSTTISEVPDTSDETGRNTRKAGTIEKGTALEESVKKVIAKAKAILAENKQYEAAIAKIKTSLYEAAVLNVNMGKLVDILVNETTTKEEKLKICERFNNVKTIAEGKTLHQTIKAELNESKKTAPAVEKQFTANPAKVLNETTIYQNTESNEALDLMSRMDNLYKK